MIPNRLYRSRLMSENLANKILPYVKKAYQGEFIVQTGENGGIAWIQFSYLYEFPSDIGAFIEGFCAGNHCLNHQ